VPPQPLSWHVDSRDGLVVVTVSGALDAAAGSALYRTLMQCLAREPVAILVELSGMTVAEADAAKIFARILQQADVWPGTPLLFCAPDPTTATLIMNASRESVPLFATVADALSGLTGRDELFSELLLPVRGAARRGRDIVTEACLRWDVPHLTAPAALAASELVSNVVVHARTVMTVQVRLRPRYLYLAVFDGTDAEPVPRHGHDADASGGRGLRLVERVSTRWGHLRRTDGKVVWASFATSSNA
jgi:anti-sigma regulatory factor (Ser/Thr protein kinase)